MAGEKEGKTELNFSDCGITKVKNFRPVLRLKVSESSKSFRLLVRRLIRSRRT